ncbi:hypothetical protein BKA62DRAFT_674729 [Auriculariales sp. MPI-PUGE-AT-0066]|nr:hypothetical protein BKA62DRAFT_674729 [Auriculariales sp. MPI-PUGE-AT-0066]
MPICAVVSGIDIVRLATCKLYKAACFDTVKDVPWVRKYSGVSDAIRRLSDYTRKVGEYSALLRHTAPGSEAAKSNTDVNGEDYNRRRIHMFGGIGLCSEEHMYIEMGTQSVAMSVMMRDGNESGDRCVRYRSKPSDDVSSIIGSAGSTRVLTMMAGAQPGGLAMYQVKVRGPRRGTEA